LGGEVELTSVNRRKLRVPLLWGIYSVLMMGASAFSLWQGATVGSSPLSSLMLSSAVVTSAAIVSLMVLIPCALTLYDALRLDENLGLADLSVCTTHRDRQSFDCCGVCGKPFCVECFQPIQNGIQRNIGYHFGFTGVVCVVCAHRRRFAVTIPLLVVFAVLFLTMASVVYSLPMASMSFGFVVIALIGICLGAGIAYNWRCSKQGQSRNLASDPEEVDNLVLRRRASTLNQPHGKSKPKAMAVVLLVVIILGVPFAVLGGIGVTALRSYQIDTSPPTTWQIIAADNGSSTLESWQRVDIYTGETTSAMFFRAVWHAPIPDGLSEMDESVSAYYTRRYVHLRVEWRGEDCNITLGHESSYYGPWYIPMFRVIYSNFDTLTHVVGVVSVDIVAKAPRAADTVIQNIQGGVMYRSNAEASEPFTVNFNETLDIVSDGYLDEWVAIPNITLDVRPSQTTEKLIAINAATFFIAPQGCGVTMTLNQPIVDILALHPDLQRYMEFGYTIGTDTIYYQADFSLLDLSSEAQVWTYPPYDNPPSPLSGDQWGLGDSFEAYYLAAQIPGLSPDGIVPNFVSLHASISWEWPIP